ncbi:type IVB secretion system protein IcmH/DotU [Oryzomicrobium sp.]|uniref:type IVB secretion system protein IcmH/DotU n=1 Tax=Oryzomicrobium sp. TaxID=1911578 RepID=UPI002FE21284
MTHATPLPTTDANAPVPLTAAPTGPTLNDLLEDGIYLLFLLRDGNPPNSAAEFNQRIDRFLAQFESNARNFGKSPDAIADAKFAFCALLDEIVFASDFAIRDDWELSPLQLRLFGQHLAGEVFFDKLETLRLDPAAHVEILEVFHTCLLLGFQGKYLIEGTERLNYLVARLGQEITHARGGKAEFAPHWRLPFKFQEFVRHELPIWLYYALLAGVAIAVFIVFHVLLGSKADTLSKQAGAPPAATAPAAASADNPAVAAGTPGQR